MTICFGPTFRFLSYAFDRTSLMVESSDGIHVFVRTRSWSVVIISELVLVFCYKPWTTAANGLSKMRESVVGEFDTKDNLFLNFESHHWLKVVKT